MTEQEQARLVQRVVSCVRWAKHGRLKGQIRSDYVLVREPLLAEEIARALRNMA